MKSLQRLLTISILCLWTTASFSQARVIIPDSLMINGDRDSEILLPQQPQQQIRHRHSAEADSLRKLSRMVTWRIDSRTGERIWASPDTLLHNFQHTTLPDGFSTAIGHLGTLGSPSINKIFFDQREGSHFVFNNVYFPFMRTPDNNLFVNTRVPYTRLTYQRSPFSFGTTAPHQEDRFSGRLSSNFGKTTNMTFDIDLLDARGFHRAQGVRHNNIGFSGNYLTDRIEVHGFANFGTMGQVENGGVTEVGRRWITHPHEIDRNFSSRDIPVVMPNANTWNRVGNNQFLLSGRYNLGFYIVDADTLSVDYGSREFIPVASIGFTSHYTQQFRRFLSHDTTFVNRSPNHPQQLPRPMHRIDTLYLSRMPFLYNDAVNDSIRFTSMRNVVSLSMREGFRDWVQFGLTAFLEHDMRTFSMRDFDDPSTRAEHREHAVTLGGVLSRQQSEYLLFNIRADMGVLGTNLGEFRAIGDIETRFNIAGRTTSLAAEAHIKNLRPRFLQQNLATKYFHWRDNNFGDTRRVRVGGRLHIPFTNTTLSAGVENIQNFIYFNANRDIAQYSGNIQILAGRIDQRMRFGIFNWDNHVVYQLSSNSEVIPLPTLAFYSNMYLQVPVATMTLQVGVDAHFHTRFYAPGYEPALLQFYNQRQQQIGNFPVATLYANLHLSRTRFFFMMYNAASQIIRPINAFTVPNYPINPWGLRVGLSTTFHN